ncbi:MAG: MBL fold metallo-hydrolase [Dysgonamonadaceae bacterium]|jgi:glyoxylase-like metal-dependent hydrolase (beta-lactamase superfamily II)|nr:MBL fold metallo-hydrolase [Dysgonamonadaceae bacterium]
MFQYQILETGYFHADGGAMFGAIPKRAWNRRYDCDEQNTCKLAMRCLLVWNDQRVILFDTGVGIKSPGKLSYYRFNKLYDIAALVCSCGFKPEQVTDVVLTHLHFDHCGGCTYSDESGNLHVTFPNALHWIAQPQWESFLHPNVMEESSFREDDMMPVSDAGLIRLVESDLILVDGINLALYNGHTKGQIVPFIKTGNIEIVYPGDVIPTRAHCSIDWISAYDINPLESIEAKLKLREYTTDKKGFMVFYHDAVHKMIPFI